MGLLDHVGTTFVNLGIHPTIWDSHKKRFREFDTLLTNSTVKRQRLINVDRRAKHIFVFL